MLAYEPTHGAETCPLSAITWPFSPLPKIVSGREHNPSSRRDSFESQCSPTFPGWWCPKGGMTILLKEKRGKEKCVRKDRLLPLLWLVVPEEAWLFIGRSPSPRDASPPADDLPSRQQSPSPPQTTRTPVSVGHPSTLLRGGSPLALTPSFSSIDGVAFNAVYPDTSPQRPMFASRICRDGMGPMNQTNSITMQSRPARQSPISFSVLNLAWH